MVQLLLSVHHLVDALELLTPCGHLVTNILPLFVLDLLSHVVLDDDFLLELINLGINNVVSDCLNSPCLNLILVDVEHRSQIFVREVGTIGLYRADLHVLLLQSHFIERKTFRLHQRFELADLVVEILDISVHKEAQELEHLLLTLLHTLDCLEVQNLLEVDDLASLDGQNNASSSVNLQILELFQLIFVLSSLESAKVCVHDLVSLWVLVFVQNLGNREEELLLLLKSEVPLLSFLLHVARSLHDD